MSHFRVRNRHYRIVVLCCGVVLAGSSSLHAANTPTIGEQEGATASVHCPNGEYLAGVAVWYDNSMSGLQPYCVRMLPNGQWQRGAHIVSDRKMSDAISGRRLDLFCPKDNYVAGFSGHTHVYGIHSLMQLSLSCLNLANGALNSIGTTKPAGVTLTEWPGVQCGKESVANGVIGTVQGATIIQLGLSCLATPRTLVQAAGSNTPAQTAARDVAPVTPAWTQQPVTGESSRSRGQVAKAPEPPPLTDRTEAAPPAPGIDPRRATPAGDRGIIIVGGSQARPGDDVALNPQPLPPKSAGEAQQQPATANPAGNVALNPQPLPPKTTLYQPKEPTVLQPAPTQVRSAGPATASAQGQIQGTSTGIANDIGVPQGAGVDLTGQLICQGGETPAISSAYRTAEDGAAIQMMYFAFANDSARSDGSGLAPGKCAFFDQSLAGTGASIVYFKASDKEREALRRSMSTSTNYWRFKVTKTADGLYYDASEHAAWTPQQNSTQALTFTHIRVTPSPRGVEFRFDGPANARPGLMIVNGPLKDGPKGTKSFDGPPLHLTAVRVSEPKPSGVAEFFASSEQHRNVQASSEWLTLEPGSQYHYSLANSGAASRQEGTFETPQEPRSGTSVTSLRQPRDTHADDTIQQEARVRATEGSKLKEDCETREPRVHLVRGTITSSRQFTVEGACLGNTGTLELMGQFPGGTLKPNIVQWGPAAIVATMPILRGVPDHLVALSVRRAPDQKRSDAKQFAYVAERQIVEIPAANFSPGQHFKDELIGRDWGEFKRKNKVKPAPVVFRIRKNPVCELDRMEGVPKIGTVLSVTASDPVPSQPTNITVQSDWYCKYDIESFLVGGVATEWTCNVEYDLRVWASCPAGIAP